MAKYIHSLFVYNADLLRKKERERERKRERERDRKKEREKECVCFLRSFLFVFF